VFFKLAARYSVQERWEEATRAYASCDHYVSQVLDLFPAGRISTLFGLGHTYENLAVQLRGQGQAEQAEEASRQAVKHYQDAGRHTSSPSHHDRLRLAFERLGRSDLAEQEAAWLARHRDAREAQRKAREEQRRQAREEANECQ
jgi:tetratricopeptide (TPR) repeat protein